MDPSYDICEASWESLVLYVQTTFDKFIGNKLEVIAKERRGQHVQENSMQQLAEITVHEAA